MNDFSSLGLGSELVQRLGQLGISVPTPIQTQAIPALLCDVDVVGQAATGTGKTAAFGLPMLQRAASRERSERKVCGLVLVPTRELAVQVAVAMGRYGEATGVRVFPVYGGQDYQEQVRRLRSGVDLVVATPGRALDHLRNGTLDLSAVASVVLDEADEMLDMGFLEDIEAILAATPAERQTALFSATMPPRVVAVAKRHLRSPLRIRIAPAAVAAGDGPAVQQSVYLVPRAKKTAALSTLLAFEKVTSALVFCRTRNDVDELAVALGEKGYKIEALHGGLSQTQRERVLKRLLSAEIQIVIATDVAARGLDVEHLSHVFNFDMPSGPETYVHRVGRVGRAGRRGTAITLALPKDRRYLKDLERAAGQRIEVAELPSAAAIRERKLAATRQSITEAIAAGEVGNYAPIFDELAKEFSPLEIALAAIKLLHIERHGELVQVAPAPTSDHATAAMSRIYISGGRNLGLRPGDLVGAITGETGIDGKAIGAITINDQFTALELRSDLVDQVIAAMASATVRGHRLSVSASPPPPSRHDSRHRSARRPHFPPRSRDQRAR